MKKGTRKAARKNEARGTSRIGRDDILPEYDFSRGKRNPYAARYTASANVVELDPDVAAVFADAKAVNDALRALAGIIEEHSPKQQRQPRKARKARA